MPAPRPAVHRGLRRCLLGPLERTRYVHRRLLKREPVTGEREGLLCPPSGGGGLDPSRQVQRLPVPGRLGSSVPRPQPTAAPSPTVTANDTAMTRSCLMSKQFTPRPGPGTTQAGGRQEARGAVGLGAAARGAGNGFPRRPWTRSLLSLLR